MPGSDNLIVTGAYGSGSGSATVQVYSIHGATHQLPSLNNARRNHACGYYYDTDHKIVSYSVETQNVHSSTQSPFPFYIIIL